MRKKRRLILEDGSVFEGFGFGTERTVVSELVFNTSMTGYQEILSDPSYTDQTIVMSYPLIGNYGINHEDYESRHITPSGLVIRDLCADPSNFRHTGTLHEVLSDYGVPGLWGVDTRRLVRHIRDHGLARCVITDAGVSPEEGIRLIRDTPVPHDAVARVSSKKKWYSRTSNPRFHVVVLDCGIKKSIVRMLNRNKCNVTLVPYDTEAEEILKLQPDGLLVSNGPGDPEDVLEVRETLRHLRGKLPMFGICLGHQLLALAFGARTYKLKFGHRGGNHPVKELATGHIEITSQNHSYAVDPKSLEGTGLTIAYENLLDHTVEGLLGERDWVMSVQFHPESAPGPCDSEYLFGRFTDIVEKYHYAQKN